MKCRNVVSKSNWMPSVFVAMGAVLCASDGLAANGNPVTNGLIFSDDFSSGNLTSYNDYFRWGDGTNIVGPDVDPVVPVVGPSGSQVQAIKFTYGTWQEVRFALTSSKSEMRSSADASSSVAYPEIFTCYDEFLPTNYFHSSNGVGAVNDKWFAIWKDGYQTSNSGVANWVGLLPDGQGNSIAAMTDNAWGGLAKGVSYVAPDFKYAAPDFVGAYAARTAESGQWHNYCVHNLVPTSAASADGIIEVYRDKVLAYSWKGIGYWAPDGDPAKAGFDRGYLLGYHNSIVPAGTQTWYITNFKIGTTAASVGLGVAPAIFPKPPASLTVN